MRLLDRLTKTVEPEAIVLSFEDRAEQVVTEQAGDGRRKWQEAFAFRFDTKVPIEKVMPGGVKRGAKVYVGQCEFEPRIDDYPGWTCWYIRWRCPDCGYLGEEYYVDSLRDVGATLSRVRSAHSCD